MRNEFVHELHLNPALTQQMFDEKWQNIIDLLTPLAKFAGASVQQLLDSETQKILTQAIDSKKEREFSATRRAPCCGHGRAARPTPTAP